jgi:hypothetical protein
MSRRRSHGTDYEPNAIDPRSGFKVKLGDLVKEWNGDLVARKYWDRRNPQDLVRGRADNQSLPYSRPEPPDNVVSLPRLTEDGNFRYTSDGNIRVTEGPSL